MDKEDEYVQISRLRSKERQPVRFSVKLSYVFRNVYRCSDLMSSIYSFYKMAVFISVNSF